MLFAHELQIGNYFEFEGEIHRISAFDHLRAVYVNETNEYFTFDRINGIDLSKDTIDFLYCKYYSLSGYSIPSVKFSIPYVEIHGVKIQCFYVHEFQNAYKAMTGHYIDFKPYIINNGKQLYI